MKSILKLSLLVYMLSNIATAQIVEIGDVNLKNALLNHIPVIDTNDDKEIQITEAIAFNGNLDISNQNIIFFGGIEAFTNITGLNCSVNQISVMNLTQNVALLTLNCSNNSIETLKLTNNANLTELRCDNNVINSLDLSHISNLTILASNDNQLVYLNHSNGNNSNYTEFNTLNNPNLACIQVDTDIIGNVPAFWQKDATANYSVDCSAFEIIEFSDSNFKNALLNNFQIIDTNSDNEIQITEAIAFNGVMNVAGKSISFLNGIEFFTNIIELDVSFNFLTEPDGISLYFLDLSNHQQLITVSAISTNLGGIDVSQNSQLIDLSITGVNSLDITQNLLLESLSCSNSNLNSLDVSQNTNLVWLVCNDNNLTSLDVSQNLDLTFLNCNNNQLSSIDISNLFALTNFSCYNNQLTQLDTSQNTNLQELYCFNNQLSNLNLGINNNLFRVHCYNNQITDLDVSQITLLNELRCQDNLIAELDLSQNTNIQELQSQNNHLTILNIANGNNSFINSINVIENSLACIKVDTDILGNIPVAWQKDVIANYNDSCTNAFNIPDAHFRYALLNHGIVIDTNSDNEIQLTEAQAVNSLLNISSRYISDLTGIEGFENITTLFCEDNRLSNLDLSQNPDLSTVYCFNNVLVDLNVNLNPNIVELLCYNNQLTSLDISQNTALHNVSCYANLLTSINLGTNTTLEFLTCYDNQLSSINTTQNSNLKSIDIGNNSLTSLDLTQNIALEFLKCDNNLLNNINISVNSSLTFLDISNNQLVGLNVLANAVLGLLIVNDNLITELDLSQNSSLVHLICDNNELSNLNIANGNNNNLNNFSGINNPNLSCIQVDTAILNNIPATWQKDAIAIYSEDCTMLNIDGFELNNLHIYPNPANDIVSFSDKTINKIEVYDIMGRKVLNEKGHSFTVKTLVPGLYIIKAVNTEGEIVSKKLIVDY